MVLNFKSPPRVVEILNNDFGYRTPKSRHRGGRPMSESNFYKILHNEFYCGWLYTMDGQKVRGKHEPMVTRQEFEKIQVILRQKGTTRPQTVSLPYRGLMQCGECGSPICLEEKHQLICTGCKHKFAHKSKDACPKCSLKIDKMVDPTRLYYVYASCTKRKNPKCTQKTTRVEVLDEQIRNYLMSLEISPKVSEWVLSQLKDNTESQVAINTQALLNQQKIVKDAQNNLDSLLIQYTQPENRDRQIISTDSYLKRKTTLEKEKDEALERLLDLSQHTKNFMGDTEEKFDFAVTAPERFNTGDYETRTEVLRHLGSNLKLLDKKILMDQDILHLFIRKANTDIRVLTSDSFEPEKSIDIYEKTGYETPVFSILRG